MNNSKTPTQPTAYWKRTHYNDFKPLPQELQAIKDALIARPRNTNR